MGEDLGSYACGCFSLTLVAILIAVLPFVFTTTDDTERAVVYSTLFARFSDTIIDNGGFHTKPYNADIIRWPRTEETIEYLPDQGPENSNEFDKILCNSKDGLLIDMHVSFQFFPDQEALLFLTQEYREYERWKSMLAVQAESTIRNVCGDFTADDFQTNRGLVAGTMESNVRDETAERFKAIVTKLQLRNVDRPDEYETAVKDKENARSEIALAENEKAQALIKANTTVDVAEEEVIRIQDTADTTAKILSEQGNAQSEGITDQFSQLAAVYSQVMTVQNLTVKGILSYVSNEVFMKDITIAVDTPAQITFKEEL